MKRKIERVGFFRREVSLVERERRTWKLWFNFSFFFFFFEAAGSTGTLNFDTFGNYKRRSEWISDEIFQFSSRRVCTYVDCKTTAYGTVPATVQKINRKTTKTSRRRSRQLALNIYNTSNNESRGEQQATIIKTEKFRKLRLRCTLP